MSLLQPAALCERQKQELTISVVALRDRLKTELGIKDSSSEKSATDQVRELVAQVRVII